MTIYLYYSIIHTVVVTVCMTLLVSSWTTLVYASAVAFGSVLRSVKHTPVPVAAWWILWEGTVSHASLQRADTQDMPMPMIWSREPCQLLMCQLCWNPWVCQTQEMRGLMGFHFSHGRRERHIILQKETWRNISSVIGKFLAMRSVKERLFKSNVKY